MNNKKGFTLIELMVVVGIIGIITGIAVPSFQRFQAKAKQANAKTELSAIYGMEKAFFTEFGMYHSNLTVIGYASDGVPLNAAGCIDDTAPLTWPVRYYRVGFLGVAEDPVPALGAALPCGGTPYATEVPAKIRANAALNGQVPAPAGATQIASINLAVDPATFTASASGNIGGRQNDVWTINQNKVLSNPQIGY